MNRTKIRRLYAATAVTALGVLALAILFLPQSFYHG